MEVAQSQVFSELATEVVRKVEEKVFKPIETYIQS